MITIFIVYKWRLSEISLKENLFIYFTFAFLLYRLFSWCICQGFVVILDRRLIETKKQQKNKKEIAVEIIFITDQVRYAA